MVGADAHGNIMALDSITVGDDIINLYPQTVPVDAVVAHLGESEDSVSTLVIAYQERIVGPTITIRLKSYQIKGIYIV